MKKILVCLNIILMLLILSSCREWKPYDLTVCENEDFIYHIYELTATNRKTYLVGLTETGMTKKEIIIPEFVDGYKIDGLGYERLNGKIYEGNEIIAFEVGENTEKIYFENASFLLEYKKLILNNAENVELLSWEYPYTEVNIDVNAYVWGYNIYSKYILTDIFSLNKYDKIANVSYMYNYENCPNEGYYWVDSYDNSLILFIPPKPEREGYVFDGWYKEAECINEWSFNVDKTNEELVITEKKQYKEYLGIYLYAKWEKV